MNGFHLLGHTFQAEDSVTASPGCHPMIPQVEGVMVEATEVGEAWATTLEEVRMEEIQGIGGMIQASGDGVQAGGDTPTRFSLQAVEVGKAERKEMGPARAAHP